MLFTMLVWGIMPAFVRSLSVSVGAADGLVIRYPIVSAIYLIALLVIGRVGVAREDWPRLAFISLAICGYNLGSSYGLERVELGVGGLIIGTQPLLIVLLSATVGLERITAFTLAGLMLALLGTAGLFWSDLVGAVEGPGISRIGALYVFLSGLSWAFYVIASRPLINRYGAFRVSAWSIIGATVPMLALASSSTLETVQGLSGRLWAEIGYIVLFGTLISAATWNYGAIRLPPSAAGAFLYLVPPIAIVAGVVILGETVRTSTILGGFLILIGVALAQYGARLTWPGKRKEVASGG